ncbi:hypothetical protein D9613_007737 [Agrocybe pediades]|uniref:Initiator tRNA phosphoribosyl transferase n=1 Tax=Agrocybe pediades TaxID=84607 RepID=A0A8H4QNX7_9AGAR|nr:hypothetical protein D9613_007737 [Agrocybe pediades]
MTDNLTAEALSYIRKESLDIFNRLHSVEEDIAFVRHVHEAYPDIPLLPNLRCGAWYTDPKIATDMPAYFKSTDGHNNNWSFNLRRANLHLLPLIVERNGVILADSTRSGKRIPDALSKTVPIWCAVINRAMLIRYPDFDHVEWDTHLYTPPSTVSKLEHSQIEQRLDGWAKSLAASSFHLPRLPFPLRPLWITPATSAFPGLPDPQDGKDCFLPVICISASKQIDQGVERRLSGFSYVQGSGDDHELWGKGLNPQLFWEHHDELLKADRAELPLIVEKIVSLNKSLPGCREGLVPPTPIMKVAGRLLITTTANVPDVVAPEDYNLGPVDYCVLTSTTLPDQASSEKRLYLPVVPGKKGQADFLDSILPRSVEFIKSRLALSMNVCVACDSGKDLSVGVALAALQLFFSDEGMPTSTIQGLHPAPCADKTSIRTRLEWIIASRPEANPSRTTLKRVNEFLLTSPSFRLSRPT